MNSNKIIEIVKILTFLLHLKAISNTSTKASTVTKSIDINPSEILMISVFIGKDTCQDSLLKVATMVGKNYFTRLTSIEISLADDESSCLFQITSIYSSNDEHNPMIRKSSSTTPTTVNYREVNCIVVDVVAASGLSSHVTFDFNLNEESEHTLYKVVFTNLTVFDQSKITDNEGTMVGINLDRPLSTNKSETSKDFYHARGQKTDDCENLDDLTVLIDPELFSLTEANSCALLLDYLLFQEPNMFSRQIEEKFGTEKIRNFLLPDTLDYCIREANTGNTNIDLHVLPLIKSLESALKALQKNFYRKTDMIMRELDENYQSKTRNEISEGENLSSGQSQWFHFSFKEEGRTNKIFKEFWRVDRLVSLFTGRNLLIGFLTGIVNHEKELGFSAEGSLDLSKYFSMLRRFDTFAQSDLDQFNEWKNSLKSSLTASSSQKSQRSRRSSNFSQGTSRSGWKSSTLSLIYLEKIHKCDFMAFDFGIISNRSRDGTGSVNFDSAIDSEFRWFYFKQKYGATKAFQKDEASKILECLFDFDSKKQSSKLPLSFMEFCYSKLDQTFKDMLIRFEGIVEDYLMRVIFRINFIRQPKEHELRMLQLDFIDEKDQVRLQLLLINLIVLGFVNQINVKEFRHRVSMGKTDKKISERILLHLNKNILKYEEEIFVGKSEASICSLKEALNSLAPKIQIITKSKKQVEKQWTQKSVKTSESMKEGSLKDVNKKPAKLKGAHMTNQSRNDQERPSPDKSDKECKNLQFPSGKGTELIEKPLESHQKYKQKPFCLEDASECASIKEKASTDTVKEGKLDGFDKAPKSSKKTTEKAEKFDLNEFQPTLQTTSKNSAYYPAFTLTEAFICVNKMDILVSYIRKGDLKGQKKKTKNKGQKNADEQNLFLDFESALNEGIQEAKTHHVHQQQMKQYFKGIIHDFDHYCAQQIFHLMNTLDRHQQESEIVDKFFELTKRTLVCLFARQLTFELIENRTVANANYLWNNDPRERLIVVDTPKLIQSLKYFEICSRENLALVEPMINRIGQQDVRQENKIIATQFNSMIAFVNKNVRVIPATKKFENTRKWGTKWFHPLEKYLIDSNDLTHLMRDFAVMPDIENSPLLNFYKGNEVIKRRQEQYRKGKSCTLSDSVYSLCGRIYDEVLTRLNCLMIRDAQNHEWDISKDIFQGFIFLDEDGEQNVKYLIAHIIALNYLSAYKQLIYYDRLGNLSDAYRNTSTSRGRCQRNNPKRKNLSLGKNPHKWNAELLKQLLLDRIEYTAICVNAYKNNPALWDLSEELWGSGLELSEIPQSVKILLKQEFSDDINGDDLLTYAYTYDIANDCILSMYNFFGTLYEKEFSDTVFIDSSASSSSSNIRSPSECQIFVTSKELLSQAIKMNSENHPEMAAKLLKQLVNMFQSFSDISSTSITRLKDHKRFTESLTKNFLGHHEQLKFIYSKQCLKKESIMEQSEYERNRIYDIWLWKYVEILKLFELGLSNLIRKIGKFFQEKGANLGLLMFDHFQNYLSQVSMVFESENDQAERWLPKQDPISIPVFTHDELTKIFAHLNDFISKARHNNADIKKVQLFDWHWPETIHERKMRYMDLQSNTLKQKIISIVFELSDEFLQGINKKAMINTDNFKNMLEENSLTFLSTEDESLFRLIVYFKFGQALAEQCAHFNSENGQHFTNIAREFEQEAKLLREQVKQLLKRKSATLLAHRNVLMNWLDSTFSRKDLRLVNENTCV